MNTKIKNKDIVVFICIFIAISATILIRPLNNLDELWNYNFARNIAEGKLPYKDFNMVQTPLLPILCAVFLKIFSNELIIMRIIAIVLNTTIVFLVYKILKYLKINSYFIYLVLSIMYFIYLNYFCLDYNFAVLLIVLMAICLEIKNLNKSESFFQFSIKKEMPLSILIGTSILFKQTSGLFLSLIFIFYKVLIAKEKQEWKILFKIVITRTIGILVPVILLTIYLFVNNIWTEFLDYTVYGIKTFTNKISYINLLRYYEIPVKVLSILVPITIIYMYFVSVVKKINSKEQKNIFILFVYSVAAFIVAFPISDSIHFLIGSMPTILAIIYIIWIFFKNISIKQKMLNFYKEFIKVCSILIIIYLILTSVILLYTYLDNSTNFSKLKHFKYIYSELDNKITEIDNYVISKNLEGKKVYILDAAACIYMIPLDKYNKNYDMFLKGNLGAKGEIGQVNNINNEKNAVILIKNNNYPRNWQNPELVREYIIKNWNKKGEINEFDIYEKE